MMLKRFRRLIKECLPADEDEFIENLAVEVVEAIVSNPELRAHFKGLSSRLQSNQGGKPLNSPGGGNLYPSPGEPRVPNLPWLPNPPG